MGSLSPRDLEEIQFTHMFGKQSALPTGFGRNPLFPRVLEGVRRDTHTDTHFHRLLGVRRDTHTDTLPSTARSAQRHTHTNNSFVAIHTEFNRFAFSIVVFLFRGFSKLRFAFFSIVVFYFGVSLNWDPHFFDSGIFIPGFL